MKKSILFVTALFAAVSVSLAAPLTPDEALARFLGSGVKMNIAAKNGKPLTLAMTTNTAKGAPAVYVFNRPDDSGFMLLSGDDIAYPLLGYADHGRFDADSIPPAMLWWLDEYGRQIEYASDNRGSQSAVSAETALLTASRADRQAIDPMIGTHWDQVAPYNDMCPLDGVVRTYTGCVATAMAQIMNYWKYPDCGQGSITYSSPTIQKRLSLDFSARAFDWDNMLDAYNSERYTDAQAEAVAYLMKACGYAVKTDYGTDTSGALALMVRHGLVNYFNYDPNTLYDLRIMHSATEWEQMVYDNLLNVGPLLYGGTSTIGGGHSFVCDGYDGDGFFHFNWGWTGMSNGYFLLDALNPGMLGSGGGSGGGYNFNQEAVFGIQPPTGKPAIPQPSLMTQMGSLAASISDNAIAFDLDGYNNAMWVNYNPLTLRFKVGARFEPQGDTAGSTIFCDASTTKWQIQAGYGFEPESLSSIYLPDLGLSDGVYKVSIATMSLSEDNAEWASTRIPFGYCEYVVLTKNGDDYSVENLQAPSVTVVDGGFDGTLYYGCNSRVWAELDNPYDVELTTGLAPILATTEGLAYLGESVLVTVPPHSTKRVEWTTPLYSLQQTYYAPQEATVYALSFMDEISMLIYSDDIAKEVTMYPNPGKPSVESSDLVVAGYKPAYAVEDGNEIIRYTVGDFADLEVSTSVTVNSGYFAYPVVACLCSTTAEADGSVAVLAYAGNPMIIGEGATAEFSTTLSYPSAQPDKEYFLLLAYQYDSQLVGISGGKTVVISLMQSGIEEVDDDSAIAISYDAMAAKVAVSATAGIGSIEAYNLNGSMIAVATPGGHEASLSLENAPRGIVIVLVRDNHGGIKSAKVVR